MNISWILSGTNHSIPNDLFTDKSVKIDFPVALLVSRQWTEFLHYLFDRYNVFRKETII